MNTEYFINLAMDGEVFAWNQKRGIPRRYREIFCRIADIDSTIRVTVHTQERLKVPNITDWGVIVKEVPGLSSKLRPWSFWGRISPTVNRVIARQYWKNVKADVYHASHYSLPPVTGPMCCTLHDMIPEKYPDSFSKEAYKELVESKRAVVMRAEKVICVSENTKRDAVSMLGVPAEKCCVIYNAGYSEERTRDVGWNSNVEKPFIFYVGGYKADYKNFKFLIRVLAAKNMLAKDKYRLIVASPEKPSVTEMAEYHDAFGGGVVKFRDDCTDDDLIELYGTCSLFVMPSLYEGFGIPVLEALSCGAPVACSNSSSLPEVGGDVVHYFRPDSIDECSVAIDEALREGRSEEAVGRRKKWAATFSWDKAAREFCEVVRELAGR